METDDICLCPQDFRMSGAEFARKMYFFWGLPSTIFLAVLFVTGVTLGIFVNPVYFILSLMAVFILLPLILMFLYYFYGLRGECYFNMTAHNFILKEDGIEVRMTFPPKDEDDEEKTHSIKIKYEEIGPYKVFSNCVVYPVGKPMKGFIWIPLSAFSDNREFTDAIALVSERVRTCC